MSPRSQGVIGVEMDTDDEHGDSECSELDESSSLAVSEAAELPSNVYCSSGPGSQDSSIGGRLSLDLLHEDVDLRLEDG